MRINCPVSKVRFRKGLHTGRAELVGRRRARKIDCRAGALAPRVAAMGCYMVMLRVRLRAAGRVQGAGQVVVGMAPAR